MPDASTSSSILVVAAISASGKPFATAYLVDQRETIPQFGLRGAPKIPSRPTRGVPDDDRSHRKLTQVTPHDGCGIKHLILRRSSAIVVRRKSLHRTTA